MASPTDSTFTCPSTCVSINTTPGVLMDKKEPAEPTTETTKINRVLSRLNDSEKEQFIARLVESAVWILETIWPSTSRVGEIQGQFPGGSSSVRSISLKRFIQEVLRRSRSSFSTLHVALYYLVQLKPQILALSRNRSSEPKNPGKVNLLSCPRRCFLSSLMVADKFLQDRNFSARAWAKISGLQATELSTNMLDFLKALDWKTFVPGDVYAQWSDLLFENALLDMPDDIPTSGGDDEVSPVAVYTPAASPIFGESEFSKSVLKRSFDEEDVRQTKRRNI